MFTPLEKRENYYRANPDVFATYQEVRKVNETVGTAFQRQRLREIKEYAIKYTRFYSKYKLDDKFPVMTKLDFMNNYEAIKSNEEFSDSLHVSSTSGSTGTPFSVLQNREKRLRTIADLKVFGEYALYPSHEKMLQLRTYNGKDLDRSVDERENIWRFDICNLGEAKIEELISFILEWKPRIIFGYVSTLETIVNYILDSEKKYDFGVSSVLVGAEMLTEEAADKIQRVFQCPIFDRYSNMEMGIYAQREFGKTNFRINKASYYCEVLKLDKDEWVNEGEVGRLVFTDLFNHAFPMIRYDTGDLGTYQLNSLGELELTQVYGRRLDSVYTADGKLVNPLDITGTLIGIKNILQWQFVQKDIGKYVLKINANGQVDEKDIYTRLQKVVVGGINIQYVDNIPVMNSQKRRCIVNEMEK